MVNEAYHQKKPLIILYKQRLEKKPTDDDQSWQLFRVLGGHVAPGGFSPDGADNHKISLKIPVGATPAATQEGG